jgi:hypothetical protein
MGWMEGWGWVTFNSQVTTNHFRRSVPSQFEIPGRSYFHQRFSDTSSRVLMSIFDIEM